jgi:hypothetical protein
MVAILFIAGVGVKHGGWSVLAVEYLRPQSSLPSERCLVTQISPLIIGSRKKWTNSEGARVFAKI